ncbi:MAG: hypothetical protein NZ518_01730 [Dehalococcoidia bacterium]|nr:hypothetical protein [Dehalococcoidia bacterium]
MPVELPPFLPPPHVTPYLQRMLPLVEPMLATARVLHEEDGVDFRPQSLGYDTGLALGFKLPFETDKLERFVIGNSSIMGRVHAQTFTAQAADGYDLPNIFFEFAELDDIISGVIDLFPVVDLALDEDYRKRVYDPLEPTWEAFRRFAGAGYHQNVFRFVRSFASPVYIGYHLPKTPENVARALEAHQTYLRHWLSLVEAATPVADPERAAYAARRKRAMIAMMLSSSTDINDLIPQLIGRERAMTMGPITAKGFRHPESGAGLARFTSSEPLQLAGGSGPQAEAFAEALRIGVRARPPFIPSTWDELLAVEIPNDGVVSVRFVGGAVTVTTGLAGTPTHAVRQSLRDFHDAVTDAIPFQALWARLSEPFNRDYVLLGNGLKLVYLYQAARAAYKEDPTVAATLDAILGVASVGATR